MDPAGPPAGTGRSQTFPRRPRRARSDEVKRTGQRAVARWPGKLARWPGKLARWPGKLAVFEAEAHLEADLEVSHLAVGDLAAHLDDLEPVQVPQGLPGTVHRVADGGLDAVRRRAADLGDAVGTVGGKRC